eukprot:scaffold88327_cov55-Phaeocystis_antarctica.AAC.2
MRATRAAAAGRALGYAAAAAAPPHPAAEKMGSGVKGGVEQLRVCGAAKGVRGSSGGCVETLRGCSTCSGGSGLVAASTRRAWLGLGLGLGLGTRRAWDG